MYLGSIRDSIKENVDDASMRADIFKEADKENVWCLAESLTRTNYRMLLIK